MPSAPPLPVGNRLPYSSNRTPFSRASCFLSRLHLLLFLSSLPIASFEIRSAFCSRSWLMSPAHRRKGSFGRSLAPSMRRPLDGSRTFSRSGSLLRVSNKSLPLAAFSFRVVDPFYGYAAIACLRGLWHALGALLRLPPAAAWPGSLVHLVASPIRCRSAVGPTLPPRCASLAASRFLPPTSITPAYRDAAAASPAVPLAPAASGPVNSQPW